MLRKYIDYIKNGTSVSWTVVGARQDRKNVTCEETVSSFCLNKVFVFLINYSIRKKKPPIKVVLCSWWCRLETCSHWVIRVYIPYTFSDPFACVVNFNQ